MADDAQPKRQRFVFLKVLGGFVLVLILAGVAISFWSSEQVGKIRDEYEANAFPTTLDELNQRHLAQASDNDNAALGVLAAANAGKDPGSALLPVLCTGTSCKRIDLNVADELTKSAAYVEANAEALRLAHAALQLKNARYPFDLNQWPPDIGHLKSVSWVARLLILEGAVAAHKKDAARATDAYVAAFDCARTLTAEPMLISMMSVASILPRLCGEIVSAMDTVSFSEDQLARLAAAADRLREDISLDRTVAGECTFGLFSNSPTNGFARPLGSVDRAAFANFVQELLVAVQQPTHGSIPALERMKGSETGAFAMYVTPMTNLMQPALVRGSAGIQKAMMRLDLCELTIAAQRYRLRDKIWPPSLSELAGDFLRLIPLDPYSNKQYRFVSTNEKFVIYSLGPDHTDDGGAEMDDEKHGDISLRVAG